MLSLLLVSPHYIQGFSMSGGSVTALVVICSFIGFVFAAYGAWKTAKISIDEHVDHLAESEVLPPVIDREEKADNTKPLTQDAKSSSGAGDVEMTHKDGRSVAEQIKFISNAIATGANAFLFAEYSVLSVFMVALGVVILIVIGATHSWPNAALTLVAFIVGALASIVSGFIGMRIAVFANSRVAVKAVDGYGPAFVTAYRAGTVMGFCLVSLALICLYILVNLYRLYYTKIYENSLKGAEEATDMYEAIAGYGLGGSSIALFGRVGGGIYTKAADVGADLTGKLEFNIPEDDARNPATIADNVGDNVGDIAGMGADLFGSFAEATCAAMVIAAQSEDLRTEWAYLCLPMNISAIGILVCVITSFFATNLMTVSKKEDIENVLKWQIIISTVLMTPAAFVLCWCSLPEKFVVGTIISKRWYVFFCIFCGLWSGLIIGYSTDYYTSNAHAPVQEVAKACTTGAATDIIYGLALGYKSNIIPVFCMAISIYVSFSLAGMFGIAMAAIGVLSTLPISLTIDAYGPICDNAGGIAEMAHMGKHIRERTDALDAAGNTTAAIGKGFAIGSALFVSIALFGAFVTEKFQSNTIDVLEPFIFAGLLIGAMLPYWFSAMTMKSVGKAAFKMVDEVRRQFTEHPEILEGKALPDYAKCVEISTKAALHEMIAPGCLVLLTPLVVGYVFGVKALAGVLVGAIVSGVQLAISMSNTGGAWDNTKKYIESGHYGGKRSDAHKAAVVGDTVGDPLKDTSGPSLNILIKLMAITSVVFARSFASESTGGFIEQIVHSG